MIKTRFQELKAQGHNAGVPLCLDIAAGKTLALASVLRVLPGKRVVAMAHILGAGDAPGTGKTVLAKIFFHKKNYLHEVNSYQQLKQSQVKTPLLLEHQPLEDGGLCFYEFLPGIKSLGDSWVSGTDRQKKLWVDKLLTLLESLYRSGIAQMDCHPGNFVFVGDELFLLDPAGCVKTTVDAFLYKHLAEIPSQFSLKDQGWMLEAIYKHFAVENKLRFERAVNKARQIRKKSYLKKIFRNNSVVADLGDKGRQLLCRRDCLSAELLSLLDKPDAAIAKGKILKDGRNSTVAKIQLADRVLVIKRYHHKNKLEGLRKLLSKNRARNNWYFAHLLQMEGVLTPQPVALLKTSNGPLDYCWYYVSSYVAADNAFNVFTKIPPTQQHLSQLAEAFHSLRAMHIEHGDCKSMNWLVTEDNMWLVDLDSMSECREVSERDKQRFLRDWQEYPALWQIFSRTLGDSGP